MEERALLTVLLPKDVKIHHIGSTAIPGIGAKPIIDILVEAKVSDFSVIKHSLLNNGYLCMNESPARISFNKGYTEDGFPKSFHLHLRTRAIMTNFFSGLFAGTPRNRERLRKVETVPLENL